MFRATQQLARCPKFSYSIPCSRIHRIRHTAGYFYPQLYGPHYGCPIYKLPSFQSPDGLHSVRSILCTCIFDLLNLALHDTHLMYFLFGEHLMRSYSRYTIHSNVSSGRLFYISIELCRFSEGVGGSRLERSTAHEMDFMAIYISISRRSIHHITSKSGHCRISLIIHTDYGISQVSSEKIKSSYCNTMSLIPIAALSHLENFSHESTSHDPMILVAITTSFHAARSLPSLWP